MKYEGMKEASFPEVVPSGCSIARVTATDNSVAENFDVLTSALEQFRDIIKEEEFLQNVQLEDIKFKLGLKPPLRSKFMKREVSKTP